MPFTRALEFLHKVHTRALPAYPPAPPPTCLPAHTPACLLPLTPPLTARQAYEPHVFWWEMLEIGRKLFLVAVAVAFGPGSVMQLVWGILVTVTFLCLRFEAQPYRSSAADHLAFSVDVLLVMVSRAMVSRAIVSSSRAIVITTLPHTYHGYAYYGSAYHGSTYHGSAYHGPAYYGSAYHCRSSSSSSS